MKRSFCLLIVVALGCTSGAARAREPVPPARQTVAVSAEDAQLLLAACQADKPDAVPFCEPGSGPPSQEFSIAISAYGRKEYGTASDVLTKVVDGWFNDNGCNRQRALFYRAKLSFKLGAFQASFNDFVLFVQAGKNGLYRPATKTWLLELRKVLPPNVVDACLKRYASS